MPLETVFQKALKRTLRWWPNAKPLRNVELRKQLREKPSQLVVEGTHWTDYESSTALLPSVAVMLLPPKLTLTPTRKGKPQQGYG